MGGCKKLENGWVFFCKKVDLSSTQGALCRVSVFFILHFTYFGGAHPPACVCVCLCVCVSYPHSPGKRAIKRARVCKRVFHSERFDCTVDLHT